MLSACMFFEVGMLHPKASLIYNGDGVSTNSVGGKSEVRAVLVQGIDK